MKPSRSVPISYVLPSWLRVPVLPIFIGTEIRAICCFSQSRRCSVSGLPISPSRSGMLLVARRSDRSLPVTTSCIARSV